MREDLQRSQRLGESAEKIAQRFLGGFSSAHSLAPRHPSVFVLTAPEPPSPAQTAAPEHHVWDSLALGFALSDVSRTPASQGART